MLVELVDVIASGARLAGTDEIQDSAGSVVIYVFAVGDEFGAIRVEAAFGAVSGHGVYFLGDVGGVCAVGRQRRQSQNHHSIVGIRRVETGLFACVSLVAGSKSRLACFWGFGGEYHLGAVQHAWVVWVGVSPISPAHSSAYEKRNSARIHAHFQLVAYDGRGLVESYDGHAVYSCVSQKVDISFKVYFGIKVGAWRIVGDFQADPYAVFNQTVFQSPGEP